MEPQPRVTTNLWTVTEILVLALIVGAISVPKLLRSREAANASRMAAFRKGNPIAFQSVSLQRVSAGGDEVAPANEDRKLIRTAALNIVVQNSSEAVDKIRILTEGVGGFLVSSDIAGGP
jgi:hypothetical protein